MTAFDHEKLLIRAYLRSFARMSAVVQITRGGFDGMWLGFLDPESLERIDQCYYRTAQQYYDTGYNQGGLWTWERDALDKHFLPGSRVVVTGAGAGREVIALRRIGFDAIGFEPHEGLVQMSQELMADTPQSEPAVRLCARDTWPDHGPGFNGAVVGWGSYMLIQGRQRRVGFLRSAAASLDPGSPILISYFSRQDSSSRRFNAVCAVGNKLRRLQRRPSLELGDALSPNYTHYFTDSEARQEAISAGLQVVDSGVGDYGWTVARVPSDGTIPGYV